MVSATVGHTIARGDWHRAAWWPLAVSRWSGWRRPALFVGIFISPPAHGHLRVRAHVPSGNGGGSSGPAHRRLGHPASVTRFEADYVSLGLTLSAIVIVERGRGLRRRSHPRRRRGFTPAAEVVRLLALLDLDRRQPLRALAGAGPERAVPGSGDQRRRVARPYGGWSTRAPAHSPRAKTTWPAFGPVRGTGRVRGFLRTWRRLLLIFCRGKRFLPGCGSAPWWQRSLRWRPRTAAWDGLPGGRLVVLGWRRTARWWSMVGAAASLALAVAVPSIRERRPVCGPARGGRRTGV